MLRTVLTVRCYADDRRVHAVDHLDGVTDHTDMPGRFVLVDVVDATDDDLARIADAFHLHPLAMEDARKHGQRPKLERYPTHAFVVAYSGRLAEVDVFVGPTWAVVVRGPGPDGAPWDITPALERFVRVDGDRPDMGTFLYVLLDEIVDGYFDAIDDTEDLLEALEDRIFDETRADTDERAIQQELYEVRRKLLAFRRAVVPVRDVVGALLRREVPWVDGEALVRLQDVYDHVLRAIDLVDAGRELMGNAVDAHLAIISNRVNRVMKTMTSWGAILFSASLIAGIYGMNFERMPELSWTWGYPLALATMLATTVVLVWWFRRRDWL